MPEEPQFLGYVRFGAGPGCACSGDRKVTYTKLHHSFGNYQTGAFGVPFPAHKVFVASGDFFAAVRFAEGQTLPELRGRFEINRRTGRANGSGWNLRDAEYATAKTTTSCDFYDPGEPGVRPARSGRTELLEPYTFAELAQDLRALWDHPDLSVWLAPVGRRTDVIFRESQGDPWGGQAWMTGGPANGVGQMVPAEPSEFWRDGSAGVFSYLRYSNFLLRQRATARFSGYFSTQEGFYGSPYRVPAGGETLVGPGLYTPTVWGPKKYWKTTGGIMLAESPEITEEEAALYSGEIIKDLNFRAGDLAPAGEPTFDWPRVSAVSHNDC